MTNNHWSEKFPSLGKKWNNSYLNAPIQGNLLMKDIDECCVDVAERERLLKEQWDGRNEFSAFRAGQLDAINHGPVILREEHERKLVLAVRLQEEMTLRRVREALIPLRRLCEEQYGTDIKAFDVFKKELGLDEVKP